jgi:D-alanine transfer protein
MHGRNQPWEQTPHLAPALTAVILAVVVLWAFGFYARSLEDRSIAALAADEAIIDQHSELYRLKNQGTALQQAALEADGLLPIYGSSELSFLLSYSRPFHTSHLFRDRPTGFATFPVGKAATTCLIIQQKLAALGPALRGRKVAISLTPQWFFEGLSAWAEGYAGNFSALHAGEVTFNTRLSLRLRQDAARRMLQYPETVANRPLLRFALENLADGSPLGLACYEAVLPLGMWHNAILRYQDHWSVVCYLWRHPARTSSPISPHGARPPDWPMLHRRAEELYRAHSNNNEFGLDNERWIHKLREETLRRRNTGSDEAFLHNLQGNQEWVDLELLLRVLTEYGAQPLLLSTPIHGGWYDQWGVRYAARRAYYQKLREVGARYHAAVVDFADHDADRSFCFDYKGHLSPSGWVYLGQVLDGFFHDTPPPRSELPDPATAAGRRAEAGPPTGPAPGSRFLEPILQDRNEKP